MDLSKLERDHAARAAYEHREVSEQDKTVIGNILRRYPARTIEELTTQCAELGHKCPYLASEPRHRNAWIDEIHRQRAETTKESR